MLRFIIREAKFTLKFIYLMKGNFEICNDISPYAQFLYSLIKRKSLMVEFSSKCTFSTSTSNPTSLHCTAMRSKSKFLKYLESIVEVEFRTFSLQDRNTRPLFGFKTRYISLRYSPKGCRKYTTFIASIQSTLSFLGNMF